MKLTIKNPQTAMVKALLAALWNVLRGRKGIYVVVHGQDNHEYIKAQMIVYTDDDKLVDNTALVIQEIGENLNPEQGG
jgi:hypothetical protein